MYSTSDTNKHSNIVTENPFPKLSIKTYKSRYTYVSMDVNKPFICVSGTHSHGVVHIVALSEVMALGACADYIRL